VYFSKSPKGWLFYVAPAVLIALAYVLGHLLRP
jgi:hypothetical protein